MRIFASAALLLTVVSSAAEPHWAYVPPSRPPVPAGAGDCHSPLDAFIVTRLTHDGLTLNPPADKLTLLRRITFDLTGLPPTPAEIVAFSHDESPDAFERLVDRLQSSPRYGERMAVEWLDLAHYADTHGYHADAARTMWPWRDWVIAALNADQPFDQFTREQLAGDLLPNATSAQKIATGFLRNHMINGEDGAHDEEYRVEYVMDRTATVGTVWLGQTLACARCHDHKYDPVSQRDFYRLFAFFNSIPETGVGPKVGNRPPVVAAPTRLQTLEREHLAAEFTRVQTALDQRARDGREDFLAWRAKRHAELDPREPPADVSIAFSFTESGDEARNAGELGENGLILHGERSGGLLARKLLCDGTTRVEVNAAKLDEASGWTAAAWITPTIGGRMTIVGRYDAEQSNRGWELGLERGRLIFRVTHAAEDELLVRSKATLPPHQARHVAVTYDGRGKAAGAALFINGERAEVEILRDPLREHPRVDQPLRIAGGAERGYHGLLAEFRYYTRPLAPLDLKLVAQAGPLNDLLRVAPDAQSPPQIAALADFFFTTVDAASRRLLAEQDALQQRLDALRLDTPTVMVMEELAQPRPTFLLDRGLFDQPRERLSPGTPTALSPLRSRGLPTRLDLANWLVDPQHPLVARVAVNREWQRLWRFGLVRTPEDWGTRGERPTHPELLDWLAREFADTGWGVKKLQRQIVTSAAYRQSSVPSESLLERDPENSLLARGPRGRLSAEMLRDSALAAADLLQERVGGPSVFPYQPNDVWKGLNYNPGAGEVSAQTFRPSRGADLYRRSLYTFWKRVSPPVNLCLFDAPDRETTVLVRGRSNSPLQALAALNDPTFVEAARELAAVALQSAKSTDERLTTLFVRTLGRPYSPGEQALLKGQLAKHQAEFARDPAAAGRFLKIGERPAEKAISPAEFAAWTALALTVANLDDALTLR